MNSKTQVVNEKAKYVVHCLRFQDRYNGVPYADSAKKFKQEFRNRFISPYGYQELHNAVYGSIDAVCGLCFTIRDGVRVPCSHSGEIVNIDFCAPIDAREPGTQKSSAEPESVPETVVKEDFAGKTVII